MTWEEIFENYWKNEDDWKEGIIDHLKNKYNPPTKKTNGYTIDKNRYIVIHNGVEKKIKKKTFEMLSYIYDNKGCIVSRNDIYKIVWDGVIVDEKTIDVHMRELRRSLPGIPLEVRKKVGIIWND